MAGATSVAANTFVELASYVDGVFQIDIDYTTGSIVNTFNGTLEAGSLSIFPATWIGTSSDPIDVAGSTSAGNYGAFSVTTTMNIDTSGIPEPSVLALLGVGLLGMGLQRRRGRRLSV